MQDSDPVVATLLKFADEMVRRLRLPVEHQHLYDDIVQDTIVVALRKLDVLRPLEPDGQRAWLYTTMFLVARNSRRAEFRRTAAFERIRNAFHAEDVRSYFDQAPDNRAEHLLIALASLGDLDRALLFEQVWTGYTVKELAIRHGLTPKAVYHRMERARAVARVRFLQEISGERGNDGFDGHE